jgi:hypothetical protein
VSFAEVNPASAEGESTGRAACRTLTKQSRKLTL